MLLARRGFLLAAAGSTLLPGSADAANTREIGDVPASGLIFKDTIKVTAFDDPKVKGVQLYITDFERPVTERLQKNFFSDPTQASVACEQVGPVTIAPDIAKGKEGEEVFEQARSLLFKNRLEPPTPGTRRRSGRGGGAGLRSPPSSWPSLPTPRSPSWPPVQSQGPITAVRACAWVSPRDIRVRLGCASNLAGPCAQLRTPAPARATRRRRAANRPSSSHPFPTSVTPGVSR